MAGRSTEGKGPAAGASTDGLVLSPQDLQGKARGSAGILNCKLKPSSSETLHLGLPQPPLNSDT